MERMRLVRMVENQLNLCKDHVRLVADALVEDQNMVLGGQGQVPPGHRDQWNTLLVNAEDLQRQLDKFIELLDNAL